MFTPSQTKVNTQNLWASKIARLFDSGEFSDCTIITNSEFGDHQFNVHRCALCNSIFIFLICLYQNCKYYLIQSSIWIIFFLLHFYIILRAIICSFSSYFRTFFPLSNSNDNHSPVTINLNENQFSFSLLLEFFYKGCYICIVWTFCLSVYLCRGWLKWKWK